MDTSQWKRLQSRVQALIAGEDRVCYYLLCENCRARIQATANHPEARAPSRCLVV